MVGVSDVTQRMVIRLIGLFVVVAIAVTLGVTLLRPDPQPVAAVRPSLASRVPGAVLPTEAADVLPAVELESAVPSSKVLQKTLLPLLEAPELGKSVSFDILDPLTGEHLMTHGASTPRTPASTAKLLTAAAALTALGPATTLPTTTVLGSRPGQVVLVGGGDVLLSTGKSAADQVNGHAGLATLAKQTAKALKSQGSTKIRLALDDRIFTGPSSAPGWASTDVDDGFVAPIMPLEINAGRITATHYSQRSSDPALAAARIFGRLLKDQGIAVSGSVSRAAAPAQAVRLGQVRSAPISGLVEYALTESDNTVAETLGRLVAAKAGRPAGFAEVGPAVLAEDQKIGVPVTGAVMSDGSGLSASSRVPSLALTGVLALAAGPDQPQLRSILSGMPIAAVSGTLADRFTSSTQQAAAGVVRAKTGTLTGVTSLAGTVLDADGRLLVFAAMADRVQSTTLSRQALDRLATALATCGCR
jgi:D-alanyl-D-alanine carboxypeptidase/D-alanyl-D-alanine-endopeptidase (penicillin-binding protein 4)